MKLPKLLFAFLIFFLALTFISQVYCQTYHLPYPTLIRNGLKVHFGDYWISTSGTDALITSWFENGWTNYTVYATGTQQIYNGTQPSAVYIDNILKPVGDGWTYSSGTVTVTAATASASMLYGASAPTYSNIGYNSTLVYTPCNFSCKWTDDIGLSGYIFSWKQGGGAWQNESWTALSGLSAWANVTETLPNNIIVIYFRWYCNNTSDYWSVTPSTTSFTTIGYYFYFNFLDMDSNSIDSIITWTLWDESGTEESYVEGLQSLVNGSYTLGEFFRSHPIGNTSLYTNVQGNTAVDIQLYVKKLGTTSRYVGFNTTISWIILNEADDTTTSFTVTSASTNILMIVDVPRNCTYIQKSGTNQTGWTYTTSPSKHVYLVAASLSTWEYYHPSTGEEEEEKPQPTDRKDITKTFYMRSETHTIHNIFAYKLLLTQGTSSQSVSESASTTSITVYWGWRVWFTFIDNTTSELTEGKPVAIVSRSAVGAGLQSSTWTANLQLVGMPYVAAIEVILYTKLNKTGYDSGWVTEATFTTEEFYCYQNLNSTWIFNVYTQFFEDPVSTIGYTYWGDSSHNTRISNVQYEDPYAWEQMYYKLQQGDFFGWLFLPYVYLIGPAFYAIIFAVLGFLIYKRGGGFTPILVLFILLGGAGGAFLKPLIPSVGFEWGWLFAVLGLTGLLFKVVKSVSNR